MSSFDQLDIHDVVLTTLAIFLCTLLLIQFNISIFQKHQNNETIDKNLSNLADEISRNFIDELAKAYKTLEKYNATVEKKQELGLFDMATNILDNPIVSNGKWDTTPPPYPDNLKKLRTDYDLFKMIFWMDEKGDQIATISTRNTESRLSELGHRSYFKNAGNWLLPGSNNSWFMLESITSVTSGEKLAALSIKSNAIFYNEKRANTKVAKVAAMTTQLTSVIDTIMPLGYNFVIIDKEGSVWFHSDTDRNLQENFLHEVNSNNRLMAAINGNQSLNLDLNYQNKSVRGTLAPLTDIPLFLVIFYDIEQSNASQTGITLNTLFFILVIFLFNGLLFVISGIINYKRLPLKGPLHSF